jgi:hypothetical protein
MPQKPSPGASDEGDPATYSGSRPGSRGKNAGLNIEQTREIGQDSPLEGSRQGREKDKDDPVNVDQGQLSGDDRALKSANAFHDDVAKRLLAKLFQHGHIRSPLAAPNVTERLDA